MAEQVIRWVTPVAKDRLRGIKDLLKKIDADPGGNAYLPFAQLPMLHFASLTIFDKTRPILLVFESNVDEPLFEYVCQLVNVGRPALDVLYSGNREYPQPGLADIAIVHFLLGLKSETTLYHVGHPNRTVREIRGDVELRRSIAHALENELKDELSKLSCVAIVQRVRDLAKVDSLRFRSWKGYRAWHPDWDGPGPKDPTPLDKINWLPDKRSWPWWFVRVIWLAAFAWLIGTALIVFLNPLIPPHVVIVLETIVVVSLIRGASGHAPLIRSVLLALLFAVLVGSPFLLKAVRDFIPGLWWPATAFLVVPGLMLLTIIYMVMKLLASNPRRVPARLTQRIPQLLEAEDLYQKNSHYNHVAGLSVLKYRFRWLRAKRSWLAMRLLNLFYRTEYVKGKLVNIPSIHFAQWSLVNNRYVLFLTNYDGPADSYLDDFFNSLAFGVAFIWQDTKIFPNSIDPRRLKLWVREGQTLASVRYRAPVYDNLTVGAINNNTFIRKRLLHGWTEASARRWLRRFATAPEEPGFVTNLVKWTKEFAGVSD